MQDFKKYYSIPAPPEEVYLALTTATALRLWTGEEAEMTTEAGSEFSLWDGSIIGKNLEFEEGKKIVQQWYFGDQKEESIVTLKIHSQGLGSSVELRHTNIPDADYNDIVAGWDHAYFGSLVEFFEE